MADIFSTIIRMSLQGTVIFMVIFLARFLLKKLCISHKYMVGLWLILFFYLVIPWRLSLPVGFWNNEVLHNQYEYIANQNHMENITDDIPGELDMAYEQHPVIEGAAASKDGVNVHEDVPIVTDSTQYIISLDLQKIFSYVWLAGAMGLFGHLVYSYYVIRKRLLLSAPYKDNIYWAEGIHTPLVFGIVFPKVFLPIHMKQGNLSYAIVHEKMHIQRRDFLWKILAYMVCVAHWFNPLVWLAYYLLGSDIEKACDEEVIRHLGEEKKKEYAYALLKVASGRLCKEKRIFVAPICFDEGNVKGRIKNIMRYKYTVPVAGVIATIIALVLAVIFMTSTSEKEEAGATGRESSESEHVVSEQKHVDDDKEETMSESLEQTDIIRGKFENILGYDGYYILDQSTVRPWFTYYYAVVGEENFLIASSFGVTQDDHIVDVDGDGINELICNVVYGDGGSDTWIYRKERDRVLRGSAMDLLDEKHDNVNHSSQYPIYLPEENVVEIYYYRADLEEHFSKKYEIDLEKIIYWKEIYSAAPDLMH